MRKAAILSTLCIVMGCAPGNTLFLSSSNTGESRFVLGDARLTQAQNCAIGFDMAREIHNRVSLRQTVFLAPPRASDCERHALNYLRQAGFRIDESGIGGASFDIRVDRVDADMVSVVATIGDSLRISRSYNPVRTGVIAASAISVQDLDPDTYASRP